MIEPLTNYLLVEKVKEEEKTASGIVLPETSEKEDSKKAKVVALGKIVDKHGKEVKPHVKKGDIIIHDAFARDIVEDDKEYQLIKYDDIMAIVK